MNKVCKSEGLGSAILGSGKTVECAVRDVLQKRTSVSRENITLSSRVGIDLGADSLDLAEIVFDLDDEIGISIDSGFEINQLTTVAEIIRAVDIAVKAWIEQINMPDLAIILSKA